MTQTLVEVLGMCAVAALIGMGAATAIGIGWWLTARIARWADPKSKGVRSP